VRRVIADVACPTRADTWATAAFLGRSTVAVSQAVTAMVDAGVVRQIKMGRRNRAFEAVGLFEAFTGFERMLASPYAETEMSPPVRSVPGRP
jgi:hypothetical protein